jgi:Xaa-Pro aminopeptidase
LGISLQEFKRRHTAIREMMTDAGLDSLVIYGLNEDFNRGNIRYATGLGRGGCCVFPLRETPVFLCDPIFAVSPKVPKFMSARPLLDLRGTSALAETAVEELARVDRGGAIGIVGSACIPAYLHEAIKARFGERLKDGGFIFERLRPIKSAEEIDKMRSAAAVADAVYGKLRQIARPGLAEFEIYGEVKRVTHRMGCEYSFDLIDAAGSSMNMSFVPTDDALRAGGTLFMEITPSYDGYYSQMPVTLPVDAYSPVVRDMVAAWRDADQAVRRILRPGTRVCDLCHLLKDAIEEKGFISPFRPGHFIGLDVLEFFSITDTNETALQPGMTVAIHPSVLTEIGGDGCGMGYTYLITEGGAERLSKIDLAKELLGD